MILRHHVLNEVYWSRTSALRQDSCSIHATSWPSRHLGLQPNLEFESVVTVVRPFVSIAGGTQSKLPPSMLAAVPCWFSGCVLGAVLSEGSKHAKGTAGAHSVVLQPR